MLQFQGSYLGIDGNGILEGFAEIIYDMYEGLVMSMRTVWGHIQVPI